MVEDKIVVKEKVVVEGKEEVVGFEVVVGIKDKVVVEEMVGGLRMKLWRSRRNSEGQGGAGDR